MPRDVDRAQLDRRPRQRAHHGARVARVGEQPQPGQHVAHLGALEVGGGARQAERDRPLLERRADHRRPRPCTDRTSTAICSGAAPSWLTQPLDVGGHRLRLRALGPAAPEAHVAAARARAAASRSRSSTGCDHRARRPAGCARRSGSCARAAPRVASGYSRSKSSMFLRARAAEAVDRLVVVARRGHVAVLLRRAVRSTQALREVRVLELVDQHVPVALGHARARTCGFSCSSRNACRIEVAEVERAALAQQRVVIGVDLRELELALGVRALGVAARAGRERGGVARGSRAAETISSLSRSIRRDEAGRAAAPGCRGSRGGAASARRSGRAAARAGRPA